MLSGHVFCRVDSKALKPSTGELNHIHRSTLMDHLQRSRDKSAFYFWALTGYLYAAACDTAPALQTVTGLMSGCSGFLEALVQVNKFWAICFHTAPFHYQVLPLHTLPPPSVDLYLINFPLCLSLSPHSNWGERELGRERTKIGNEVKGKFV